MLELARAGTSVELSNLPREALRRINRNAVIACGDRLALKVAFDKTLGKALISRSAVPDNYSLLQRSIGLYPFMAFPVVMGFNRWQAQNLPDFAVPFDQNIGPGKAEFYSPPQSAGKKKRYRNEKLKDGLPIGRAALDIALQYAPSYKIQTAGDYDLPGEPTWLESGELKVDSSRPVTYYRLSRALWKGKTVLQVSYLLWFSERPSEGDWDILAGKLDGVYWRVTLDEEGEPLIYDTIHPCGCYHLFFPTKKLRKRNEIDPALEGEGYVVPVQAPEMGPDEQVALRISSKSHYVNGLGAVRNKDDKTIVYHLYPEAELRSLPVPGQPRGKSLYGVDGIVSKTERSERFLLWPMGIDSPGAMRQWGHHATAFVGRRHFDDPYLFERIFEER